MLPVRTQFLEKQLDFQSALPRFATRPNDVLQIKDLPTQISARADFPGFGLFPNLTTAVSPWRPSQALPPDSTGGPGPPGRTTSRRDRGSGGVQNVGASHPESSFCRNVS